MEHKEIIRIIEEAAKSWINADPDAFAALFSEQGEFIVPGMRWVGPEAIRQAVAYFIDTSSDVSINISQILIGSQTDKNSTDARAMIEWHWENTEKATGKRSKADDAIAVDFQNGRISRWREYIDAQTWAS